MTSMDGGNTCNAGRLHGSNRSKTYGRIYGYIRVKMSGTNFPAYFPAIASALIQTSWICKINVCPGCRYLPLESLFHSLSLSIVVPKRLAMSQRESPFLTV